MTDNNSLTVTVNAEILLGLCNIVTSLLSDQLGRQAAGKSSYDADEIEAFKEVLSVAAGWAAAIERERSAQVDLPQQIVVTDTERRNGQVIYEKHYTDNVSGDKTRDE